MRLVFMLVLILGLGLAGFAVMKVMQQFQGYQAQIQRMENERVAPIETVTVIIAAREVRFGQQLTRADVAEIQWPKSSAPANAFNDMAVLFGPEGSASRSVTRVMEPGEPILVSKVTNIGEPADLRSTLEDGMRAFTINVDAVSGVGGFLQPGDRVDVYWSGTGANGETVTRLIEEDLVLIALDQTADQDVNRPQLARTATLQVSPSIVAKMVQAQATGRLTLSLRGLEDSSIVGTFEVDRSTVVGESAPAPIEEIICTRKIRRGVEVVEEVIPCEGPAQSQ